MDEIKNDSKLIEPSKAAGISLYLAPISFIIVLATIVGYFLSHTLTKEHLSASAYIDVIVLLFIMLTGMCLTCTLIILKAKTIIEDSLKLIAQQSDAEVSEQKQISLQAAKMSALGEMVGGIAHEINTPLAAIKLFLSESITELEKGNKADFEELANYIHKSDATIDRIAKIIKGLRTFARSGELDPFQDHSVQECIEDAVLLCEDRFRSESVDLRWEIPASTIMIECRPIEITQVLLNLMNNAMDAVSKLPERWVTIQVGDTPDFVQIRVTDSGTGIPPEHLEKIFQPFFTTKEIGKGTGIGLSISVGIIKSHNGRIFIDPGHLNTSFVIEIPKRQNLELNLEELKGSFE